MENNTTWEERFKKEFLSGTSNAVMSSPKRMLSFIAAELTAARAEARAEAWHEARTTDVAAVYARNQALKEAMAAIPEMNENIRIDNTEWENGYIAGRQNARFALTTLTQEKP